MNTTRHESNSKRQERKALERQWKREEKVVKSLDESQITELISA